MLILTADEISAAVRSETPTKKFLGVEIFGERAMVTFRGLYGNDDEIDVLSGVIRLNAKGNVIWLDTGDKRNPQTPQTLADAATYRTGVRKGLVHIKFPRL